MSASSITTPARKNRLAIDRAQLLIVDIQEKLLPHIHDYQNMLAQAEKMIRAAVALEIPVTISEQYPRGLGPTHPTLVAAATGAPRTEKMTFSYCAEPACAKRISSLLRPDVLLVGMEAHVCVQQTALDLLEMQMQPYVLADAVGARRPRDYDIALERMRHAGAIVTTVESAIFQLVHASGTDLFKRILPIVK
jgi:nicotinamidase-related amidase